jgi:UDP-N-acetylmuramoylalanine--D-glutamate ligase
LKNLIIGYGITGKSVEKYLIKKEIDYLIHDDIPENLSEVKETLIFKDEDFNNICEVIISPGISPDNPLVEKFLSKNIPIKTDIDLFASYYKGDIIGVTGTNGKTTFVNELSKFLNLNNIQNHTAGNVGVSPLEISENVYDYVILELSSYQLHYTSKLNLDLAIILNIYSDHIDWHKTFTNYSSSKIKILSFLDTLKGERKVIGSNNDVIKSNLPITSPLHKLTSSKIHPELLIALGESVKIIGGQDLYNLFCEYIKVNEINYPHRLEEFKKLDKQNVTFINDSKATNYHAVSQATKLFSQDDVEGVLILHGITKETSENSLDIDPSFKKIIIPHSMNVKLGAHSAEVIYIDSILDLKEKLESLISCNQVILFSCGGASFNDFKNYEERGNYFKDLITSMDLKND